MNRAKGEWIIAADDQRSITLNALIKGITHFEQRDLTTVHLKLVLAADLCKRVLKRDADKRDLASLAKLRTNSFDQELLQLVERRYLHHHIPTFGTHETYRLGAVGGTALRNIMEGKIVVQPAT